MERSKIRRERCLNCNSSRRNGYRKLMEKVRIVAGKKKKKRKQLFSGASTEKSVFPVKWSVWVVSSS